MSICHAAWVVISAGLARGRRLTGSRGVWDDIRNAGGVVVDEPYVEDGNVISTRSYSDFPEFWPRLEAKLRGMGILPGRYPIGPADSREGAPNAAARGTLTGDSPRPSPSSPEERSGQGPRRAHRYRPPSAANGIARVDPSRYRRRRYIPRLPPAAGWTT